MIFLQQIRVFLEDRDVVDQQIAEVARIQHFQPRLINLVTGDALAVSELVSLFRRHLVRRQRR